MGTIIEVINALFEIFIVLFFFKQTLSVKRRTKFIQCVTIFSIAIIHILRSFFMLHTYLNFLITLILWSVLIIVLFNGTPMRKVTMMFVYFKVLIICDVFARFIVDSILGSTYNTLGTIGLQRYIGMAINILLSFVITYSIALFVSRKQTTMPFKYWIMLLLFPVFSLFIIVSTDIFMVLANINDIKYIFILLTIILGLLYFNTIVFEFIDSYSSKIQLEAAEKIIAKQEENYKLLEDNETTLRVLNHDIKKHMSIMQHMIENHYVSETKEFIQSLKDLSALPLGFVYTNDITLDSILNVECKKATLANIRYSVKVNNITEPLHIHPADKSTIFCNAIDNAIEAATNVRDGFIVLTIFSDKQYIKICLENSSVPIKIKNGVVVTSKNNNLIHGFGIKSIKQTIKKYNGHFNISYNDGIAVTTILMKNVTK